MMGRAWPKFTQEEGQPTELQKWRLSDRKDTGAQFLIYKDEPVGMIASPTLALLIVNTMNQFEEDVK